MSPIEYLNRHMKYGQCGTAQRWQRYYEPVLAISDDLPIPILGIMLLIWQLRDADLQQAFPLDSADSRVGFLLWCACHGRAEYAALAEASNYWKFLQSKAELPSVSAATDPGNAISNFMLLIWHARKDLSFDITQRKGRAQFVLWYLVHGRAELRTDQEPLATWQEAYFAYPSEMESLNCLQMLVYESRSDLHIAFPLPAKNSEYLAWYKNEFITPGLLTTTQYSDTSASPYPSTRLSRGVNVIGYAFGQLGIGEDARMATKSLLSSGIDTALINFAPGDNIPQRDMSMSDYVRNDIIYNVNIFCLTAIETARYFAKNGSRHFSFTFNIGYWPWELEEWPDEWRHLFALVDEVWASSMHTYKSIFSYSTVPVSHVPMAVAIPHASSLTRKDFDLPDDARLFLFSFDLNSSAKRKNPTACVEAFLLAFPDRVQYGATEVGLVIKVHPPTNHNEEWEKLKLLRISDPRIHIIESTLDREDLVALYKNCDCFISLHRAEGFGRNIAESMLLGTPVITTAYSGNLDFTNNTNSYMVGYRDTALEEKDYPYGSKKFWAEPDINEAAEKIREVINNPEQYRLTAHNAVKQIERQYSFYAVGERYRLELSRIWRQLS